MGLRYHLQVRLTDEEQGNSPVVVIDKFLPDKLEVCKELITARGRVELSHIYDLFAKAMAREVKSETVK